MHGTRRPIARRVLAGAMCLGVFALIVVVAVRSVPDAPVPPALVADAEPVRLPRVRASPPEAPAPPPPRSIRVAVTSMDGTPIPGAFLELVRGPSSERPDGDFRPSRDAPRTEIAAVAGEDGVGTLRDVSPGRWFVFASAPSFARHLLLGTTRDEDDAAVETSVALEKGSTFTGTVLDPDGKPAGSVFVILQPVSMWPSDAACLRTMTGKDGAYCFDGVEPGRYVLWYSQWPGPLISEARVLLPSLDGYDIRMAWGAMIDGTVVDADTGAAVPGARVHGIRFEESHVSGFDGATTVFDVGTADSLGRFRLHTWRRQFEVTRLLVEAPGYVPTPVDDTGRGPPGAVSDGQRFEFGLRVRRGATLKGKLVGPDGPLAGIQLRVWPSDDAVERVPRSDMWTTTTGADGSFVVDALPAGAAKIFVRDQVSGIGTDVAGEIDLVPDDSTTHEVRLEIQRARVTRTIRNSADEPVAGVRVAERFGPLRAEAITDSDGRFTLDAIFPGESPAFVELTIARFRAESMVTLGDEEGSPLSFCPIPSVPVVTGRLVRKDESPAAGVRAVLAAGVQTPHDFDIHWSGLRESVSAADGTFGMPLTSGPDSYVSLPLAGWLENESAEDGSVRITVPDVAHVAGIVVAAESGEPIAGAEIRSSPDTVVARTGADGRFDFTWMPPSDEPLTATCDGRLPSALEPGVAEHRVELRRAHVVSGVVRRADGAAASGLQVLHWAGDVGMEGGRDSEWTLTSATDADGRFEIPGLDGRPGVVRVADPVRHAMAGTSVAAPPGGGELSLVVRPAIRLVVLVVDGAGEPVRGATASVCRPSQTLAEDWIVTDSEGRAELGVDPDATYTLRVERYQFETVERSDVRTGGDPLRVVLVRKD